MTCAKFGSDRLNGSKVEKRDGQTDRQTHRQTNVYFNRIGLFCSIFFKLLGFCVATFTLALAVIPSNFILACLQVNHTFSGFQTFQNLCFNCFLRNTISVPKNAHVISFVEFFHCKSFPFFIFFLPIFDIFLCIHFCLFE